MPAQNNDPRGDMQTQKGTPFLWPVQLSGQSWWPYVMKCKIQREANAIVVQTFVTAASEF